MTHCVALNKMLTLSDPVSICVSEDSPLAKRERNMKDCDHVRHLAEPLKSQMAAVLFFSIMVL